MTCSLQAQPYMAATSLISVVKLEPLSFSDSCRVRVDKRYFSGLPYPLVAKTDVCFLNTSSAALKGRAYVPTFQPCKATSDSSGRAVSGESILLNEQALDRELQIAIEQENYTEAAKIRDKIRILHEDSEASVLAVNARFYNAFRTGDLASMQTLWAKGDNVCCVHPGASGISGYELVMKSWEYVWVDYEFPLEIELRDVQVHVRGDVGYVTCVELVKTKGSSWGRQFATNVFERVNGQWFISVHHASPIDL
ncbi:hypothetical protein vseg_020598 [Gypsophila vaccaria]